jgi:homoserine O-acetyltransferase/O-succinyltransferase
MKKFSIAAALVGAFSAFAASAADYPAPKQGDWIARDFVFHTGAAIPELKLHYTTIGEPTGLPVVMLHGTGSSAAAMLTPAFAGALFGPGQPLDARKYYIILPDAIGAGGSSKPSDGLRQQFPKYNYDDMVEAQHRLVTEGLGVRHVRLVMGNSMGGMQTWLWAEKWPTLMDAAVPMAAQPTAMSARNWMLRRMLTETIRSDPEFQGGNYTTQPRFLKIANVFYGIATSGGTLAYQDQAPTNALATKLVDERLAAPAPKDANDFLYQWESSADYDPAPGLEKIRAAVLAINAADDERNPPETGVMQKAMARVRDGRLLLIPASPETRGHGTTSAAKFYAAELAAFLQSVPERAAARAAAR